MIRSIATLWILLVSFVANAQTHPITFLNKSEANDIKIAINKYPILQQSFNDIKTEVDAVVNTDVDVPFPKDPAGGYTHDKHKSNYMLMFNSGLLYNITGEAKYAALVRNMLLKYAKLNPTLKNHPQATGPTPGRLFWQSLNDANWMVYTGLAYDLVYNYLSESDRKNIEQGAFKPEVDYLTIDLKSWYDRLHNHSVWAAAGVGIIGIATNNQDYIDKALYGSDKDGKTGFIAQMDLLFSPDGYYTEGPYYVRYAILPYMLFANALNNSKPALKIFEHRNNILQKALLTCLQQTNLKGSFIPLNDALKEKDFTSNELVTSIDIAWKQYGTNLGLLSVAKKQNRVSLDKGGVLIAAALQNQKSIPAYFPYKTIESKDGVAGDEGGITILRNGANQNLRSLVFKYASQGMGHGHFDRLAITLFDKDNEILQDYGSARFIGIEQKYGGRYLSENTMYASQTIAHNTLVMDEQSHFNGDFEIGQKSHPKKLFSAVSNSDLQVVSAIEENAYKGNALKRTLFFINTDSSRKYIVDIFSASSTDLHQYDMPFQYNGQVISTNFKYQSPKVLETLGSKSGYQFIWKEAVAKVKTDMAQFTFLNTDKFYTVSSLVKDSAEIFLTRLGANDPSFNLRREPAYIIRTQSAQPTFINVIEMHGNYDTRNEFSTEAYSNVKSIKILSKTEEYTIAKIELKEKSFLIALSNKDFTATATHTVVVNQTTYTWTGPYLFKETVNTINK